MHVTRQGTLCNQHLRQYQHLRITKSDIPGAGLGLFTTVDIPKGGVIAQYTGDIVVEHDPDYANPYSLQIKERPPTFIDASRTNTGEARFANDARGPANNALLIYNNKTKKSYLKAARDIEAGEEILTNYGDEYWDVDSNAHSYYIPNIKKMRENKDRALIPRADAVRHVASDDSDDDEDWLPEGDVQDEEAAPPKPKKKPKKKRQNPRVLLTKPERFLQRYANAGKKRLAVIQKLFESKKLAEQLKVTPSTRQVPSLPDREEDELSSDYQKRLSDFVAKEEKALAKYLKSTPDKVNAMITAMTKRKS